MQHEIEGFESMTLEQRLEAYQRSSLLAEDVGELADYYHRHGFPIPTEEQLQAEAIDNCRIWLERYAQCESEGHQWQEDAADPENGTSDLTCDRCGEYHHLQW